MQSMNCLARSLACVRARACSRSILKSPLDAICVLSVNVFPRAPLPRLNHRSPCVYCKCMYTWISQQPSSPAHTCRPSKLSGQPCSCASKNTYAAISERLSADIVQRPAGKPESPPCSIISSFYFNSFDRSLAIYLSVRKSPQILAPSMYLY